MRIADKTITRNYLSDLSSNTEQRNSASEKVYSGRSYQKASEDPAAAIKAMKVRSTLSKIDTYQDNISEVSAILSEREAVLSELTDILTEVKDDVLQGRSGTYSAADRSILAKSLGSYQETILSLGNQRYCDKYVFGGTNEYEIPFTADVNNGNLLYHGQDMETGVFGTEEAFIDIGLGIEGASGYNIASAGTELLGTGTDSNGLSNNVYNLIGDIADIFNSNDLTDIDKYVSKLDELSDNVLVQYTSVGEEKAYISMFNKRLTTSEANAIERQSVLEVADVAEASMVYAQQKTAYQATLQVGAQLIQQSLLDYLN